jgi:hypothetical protein
MDKNWYAFSTLNFLCYVFMIQMISFYIISAINRKKWVEEFLLKSFSFFVLGSMATAIIVYLSLFLHAVSVWWLLLWLIVIVIGHGSSCVLPLTLSRYAFLLTIGLISILVYFYIQIRRISLTIYEFPEIYLLFLPSLSGRAIELLINWINGKRQENLNGKGVSNP